MTLTRNFGSICFTLHTFGVFALLITKNLSLSALSQCLVVLLLLNCCSFL